jgi:hypothetical protein
LFLGSATLRRGRPFRHAFSRQPLVTFGFSGIRFLEMDNAANNAAVGNEVRVGLLF